MSTVNEQIHRRVDRLEASVDAALSVCDEELESWAFHRGNTSPLRASMSSYHHQHHPHGCLQQGYEMGSDRIHHTDHHRHDDGMHERGLTTPTRWSDGVMYSLRLSDLAGVGSTRTLEDIAVNGVCVY